MLINAVQKTTGLTKKAIEYYIGQGLLSPTISENGYRDFTQDDMERLRQISILRKLGISTEEIKSVLSDKTGNVLKTLSVQKELNLQREHAKKSILDKLRLEKNNSAILAELQAIDNSKTITEKLLEAFPGYFGRFVCLHFARFLNEPIQTERQKAAYEKILSFLDSVPSFTLPEDLQDYLTLCTDDIGTEQITAMIDETKKSIENPDAFLSDHMEILQQYVAYKKTTAYQNSPAYRLMQFMKAFFSTSGYYELFLPALKELSSSYSEYCHQLEIANEKLLVQFPEIGRMENEANHVPFTK